MGPTATPAGATSIVVVENWTEWLMRVVPVGDQDDEVARRTRAYFLIPNARLMPIDARNYAPGFISRYSDPFDHL